MSLSIDDLESEAIAFLVAKGCLDTPVVVHGWKVSFDGRELSISETPVENSEQMDLFERSAKWKD